MQEFYEAGTLSRYDMSLSTYRQLQRDHIRFEEQYTERFSNGYICRILINYMCYAQNHFLERLENEVVNILNASRHDEYIKDDRISFTKQLTNKISEFDFSANAAFKKRIAITFLLEQFTLLSLSEREKIYCYQQFKAIQQAIENSEILIIKLFSGKEFEMKPFDLRIDENTLSYYLTGYSRPKGSEGTFESHSFKLSRIKECRSKHKEFVLSYKEIRSLVEINEKFGCAYIVKNLEKKEIEKTIVRLSKKGYELLYLRVISHQRPIPIKEPQQIDVNDESFYELVFDCSYQQIKNYFFSFGAEVEIISPNILREQFISDYRASLEKYVPCD